MIPKIIFRYSWIYDQNWKKWIKIYRKNSEEYPSFKKIQDFIKKIEKLWQKHEKKVLTELSKISKLKWKEKAIYCYVVGRCIAFSDPLTLPVYEKHPDYFIDTLIHELIHQLFTQRGNLEKSKKAWRYINSKYNNETHKTRIHIPLHAIHSNIYLKFFNEKRLQRDINLIKFLPDYRKSWKIVQKQGYKNITKEFTKRITPLSGNL